MTLDEIKQQDFSPFDRVAAWRGRAYQTSSLSGDMHVNWLLHDFVTGQEMAGLTSRSFLMDQNADEYAAGRFIRLADVDPASENDWTAPAEDWHCGSSYEFARWLCNLLSIPYCRRNYDS